MERQILSRSVKYLRVTDPKDLESKCCIFKFNASTRLLQLIHRIFFTDRTFERKKTWLLVRDVSNFLHGVPNVMKTWLWTFSNFLCGVTNVRQTWPWTVSNLLTILIFYWDSSDKLSEAPRVLLLDYDIWLYLQCQPVLHCRKGWIEVGRFLLQINLFQKVHQFLYLHWCRGLKVLLSSGSNQIYAPPLPTSVSWIAFRTS